jgi:surface antigen
MRTKRVVRVCLLVLALVASTAACTSQTSAPNVQPATSTSPTPAISESIAANGYSYGYGTYYVAARRDVPPNWGNARTWYTFAQRDGYKVGDTPKKGAIAWTDRGPLGQVAIVEDVSADLSQVVISEMNGEGGGWNQVTTRTAPAMSFKYIY